MCSGFDCPDLAALGWCWLSFSTRSPYGLVVHSVNLLGEAMMCSVSLGPYNSFLWPKCVGILWFGFQSYKNHFMEVDLQNMRSTQKLCMAHEPLLVSKTISEFHVLNTTFIIILSHYLPFGGGLCLRLHWYWEEVLEPQHGHDNVVAVLVSTRYS